FVRLDFARAVHRAAVALNQSPLEVMSRLFGAGDPLSADRMAYMTDYECGRIDDAAFHRNTEKVLGGTLPFEVFKDAWNDIFLEPIRETVQLAEELHSRGGIKLGLLSNNNALHWNFLLSMTPILRRFEHVFLSHEVGLRKPQPEFFQHALTKMQARAEQTVFVDDLDENVRAAEALGMKTVLATSPQAVRE